MSGKIQAIDDRLQRWALAVTVGDGSGYPVTSVLHPNWSPPSPGMTPTIKTSASSDVKETHAAICTLQSENLMRAVVAHYIKRGTIEAQSAWAGCKADTLMDRVARAHREIARGLAVGNAGDKGPRSGPA
jgi:hypothetical protein